MGLKHRRTRPYSPQTNGKAERFIQTALREWAYGIHWPDSEQRNLALAPWTDYYNFERPHGSLHYQPPISRSSAALIPVQRLDHLQPPAAKLTPLTCRARLPFTRGIP